ncbi:hypothetical protein Pst134EA_030492 [Puccinia striiformis f. sp. tritici]|nr:hypothetical protein Pst134EA_030492 [Puccinia striiformis f. sp. tritici]KAH9446580.1 hypothetical protein Pst134EA_030492 [Puccinia striiformis f. sp. tritici]KAI9600547.1 hypothetical protein H4Q26_000332 [Puccinia striiformis f. sp. tritici PST-130]
MPRKKLKKTTKVTLTLKLLQMNDSGLTDAIIEDAAPCYSPDQPLKRLQVEAMLNLIRLRHTFVRGGTGFGKSCVAEIYCHLFAKTKNLVVLVLNPLDALSDNQVQEKITQGFTAINPEQTNFNKSVAGKILRGKMAEIFESSVLNTFFGFGPFLMIAMVSIMVDLCMYAGSSPSSGGEEMWMYAARRQAIGSVDQSRFGGRVYM